MLMFQQMVAAADWKIQRQWMMPVNLLQFCIASKMEDVGHYWQEGVAALF